MKYYDILPVFASGQTKYVFVSLWRQVCLFSQGGVGVLKQDNAVFGDFLQLLTSDLSEGPPVALTSAQTRVLYVSDGSGGGRSLRVQLPLSELTSALPLRPQTRPRSCLQQEASFLFTAAMSVHSVPLLHDAAEPETACDAAEPTVDRLPRAKRLRLSSRFLHNLVTTYLFMADPEIFFLSPAIFC